MSQEKALAELSDAHFEALANRMVAKGTWFDPTLIVYWTRAHQWSFANDPRNQYMSATAKQAWTSFQSFPTRPRCAPFKPGLLCGSPRSREIVRRRGVRFLVGTDLGVKYVYPGFSVHEELGLLRDVGLTPMEILLAATRHAAESLGVLDQTGPIEVGKAADLVLLDADPLADIGNTKRIAGVMRNGRFHDRRELDAMLAKVAVDAPLR